MPAKKCIRHRGHGPLIQSLSTFTGNCVPEKYLVANRSCSQFDSCMGLRMDLHSPLNSFTFHGKMFRFLKPYGARGISAFSFLRGVGRSVEEKRKELQQALHDIEQRIEELEQRIPPHSVKPHFIQQLDELEAERDRILDQLKIV